MKRQFSVAAALALIWSATSVFADKGPGDVEQAEPGAGLTVYMDVSVMGRKKRAAARMTEFHNAYFAKGWTVVDVDPYIENGDLQGFFITYVGRE